MKILVSPCLWLCLMIGGPIEARNLGVLVEDEAGSPIPDAVVTLSPRDPPTATPAESAAGPIVSAMDQRDKAFVPHVLVVRPGTRVEFPNSDRVQHHVYSFSPPKPFELKLYSEAEVPAVVFDRPGVVSLGCNIHDWMRGYVYVTEARIAAQTGPDGVSQFTGLVDGVYELVIWHPRLRGPYMGNRYALNLDERMAERVRYRIAVRAPRPLQQAPAADMDPSYASRF